MRALATVALEGAPVEWLIKPLTDANGEHVVMAESADDALGIVAKTPAELAGFAESLRMAVKRYTAIQEIIERDPIG